jgi:hypothetical protein
MADGKFDTLTVTGTTNLANNGLQIYPSSHAALGTQNTATYRGQQYTTQAVILCPGSPQPSPQPMGNSRIFFGVDAWALLALYINGPIMSRGAFFDDRVGIGTPDPNAELHVMGNGLFDFGATGSVNVSTPLGNPGVVGLAPNGNRRDIRFSNDGIELTVSGGGTTNVPPDLTIYPDRVGIRTNVCIGPTNPSQRLTLGSGNILLPNANGGVDGNLYFGGTTDTGQVGLRLFGGNVNNGEFKSGFIDVRAGTPTDGLIFRVDTSAGGTERMRIRADGNIIVPGDILLQNADCAEDFAVTDCEGIGPGTVMVLNEEGSLRPSTEAYDKKVAGVISGAGGLKPGLILDKQPDSTNRMPIALMGKVCCKVDAQYAPIEVGDLLTTSPTSGHAMKATDPAKAFGTVIGKALKPLKEGAGFIPILVSLQ